MSMSLLRDDLQRDAGLVFQRRPGGRISNRSVTCTGNPDENPRAIADCRTRFARACSWASLLARKRLAPHVRDPLTRVGSQTARSADRLPGTAARWGCRRTPSKCPAWWPPFRRSPSRPRSSRTPGRTARRGSPTAVGRRPPRTRALASRVLTSSPTSLVRGRPPVMHDLKPRQAVPVPSEAEVEHVSELVVEVQKVPSQFAFASGPVRSRGSRGSACTSRTAEPVTSRCRPRPPSACSFRARSGSLPGRSASRPCRPTAAGAQSSRRRRALRP